jgi:hypothetical protein
MCIPASSQYIPEAIAFLDYFFNNHTAARILGAVRSIPAVRSSRSIVFQNNLASALTISTVNMILSCKGTQMIGSSSSATVKSILSDAISSVAYGIATPEQAAARTFALLNSLKSQNRSDTAIS